MNRVGAQDMVPVNRRRQLRQSASLLFFGGKVAYGVGSMIAWALATTVLVVVIPLGVELEYEQQALAWENEARAQQEQAQQVRPSAPTPDRLEPRAGEGAARC